MESSLFTCRNKFSAYFFVFITVMLHSSFLKSGSSAPYLPEPSVSTTASSDTTAQPTTQIPANLTVLTDVYINTETGHFFDADGNELTGLQYGPYPQGIDDPRFPLPADALAETPMPSTPGIKDQYIAAFKKAAWGKDLTTQEKAMVSTFYSTIDTIKALNKILEPIRNEKPTPASGWNVTAFIASAAWSAKGSSKSFTQVLADKLQEGGNRELAKAVVTKLMDTTKTYFYKKVAGYNAGNVDAGTSFEDAAKMADRAAFAFGVVERIIKGETRWYDRALFWVVDKVRSVTDWMRTSIYKRSSVLDSQSSDLISLAVQNSDFIGESLQSVPYVGTALDAGKKGIQALKKTGKMISYVVSDPKAALGDAWQGAISATDSTKAYLVQNVADPVKGALSNASEYTGTAAVTLATAAQDRAIQAYENAENKGSHVWQAMKDAGEAARQTATNYTERGMTYVARISPRTAGVLSYLGTCAQTVAENLTFDSEGMAYGFGWTNVDPSDMENPSDTPSQSISAQEKDRLLSQQEEFVNKAWEEQKEFEGFFNKIEMTLGGDVLTHKQLVEFIAQQQSKKAALETLTPASIALFDAETIRAILTLFSEELLAQIPSDALDTLEEQVNAKLATDNDFQQLKDHIKAARDEQNEEYADAEGYHFENPAAATVYERIKTANWSTLQTLTEKLLEFNQSDVQNLTQEITARTHALSQTETPRMQALISIAQTTTLDALDAAKNQADIDFTNDPTLNKAYQDHQSNILMTAIDNATTLDALTAVALEAQQHAITISESSDSPISQALLSRHQEIVTDLQNGAAVQPRVTTATGSVIDPVGGNTGQTGTTGTGGTSTAKPQQNLYPLPEYSPADGAPNAQIHPRGDDETEEEYEARRAAEEQELHEEEEFYESYENHEQAVQAEEAAKATARSRDGL